MLEREKLYTLASGAGLEGASSGREAVGNFTSTEGKRGLLWLCLLSPASSSPLLQFNET